MANISKTATKTQATGNSPGIARAPEKRTLDADDQESPPDYASGMEAA